MTNFLFLPQMAEGRDGPDNRDPNQQAPDDDLSVPRAALNKMIKELLPNIRVANDARELISNCCTEFIHLVSSEANEACVKQNKKTISPDHILSGLYAH
ncbi:protein dr1 [Plakobranchus ocellatus]|uniref:Protein Dr1 n=1 Tax=Plakobranchus ocellatus TaxID=259542 RepID=A0AAV3XPV0_9GAST|nr:protein dr1 [Plakobranchus ocellatus]